MKTVAFIPVRGGSKSIPLKNITVINGKPLVYWALYASQNCEEIDEIYVATDSKEIREVVEGFCFSKVKVIGRSEETATDEASTESVMLEFAEKYTFDTIILVQATSPLLKSKDLCKGMKKYGENDVDSVLSVVRQKRFVWKEENGGATPVNYDFNHRPRRQEFNGFFVENGAFYITSKHNLLQSRCRISGNIALVEMPEETYFEVDEPSDWLIVEQFLRKHY